MIELDGKHVLLTLDEYRKLLSLEKPAAFVALEAADAHLCGHISNGHSFEAMAERVLTAAQEYVAVQRLMGEEVEHAASHSDAVGIYIAAAREHWEAERKNDLRAGDTLERCAMAALKAADGEVKTHLLAHCGADDFYDMAQRVRMVAKEYMAAERLMPSWLMTGLSHSQAVKKLVAEAECWREIKRKAAQEKP